MANTENQATMENWVNTEMTEIIEDVLGVDKTEIVDDANFTQDLGADSLDTVDLILQFEKYFGVNIPNKETENIQTFGDAKRAIIDHLRTKNKARPDEAMVSTQLSSSVAPNTQKTDNKIEQIFKTYPRILEVVKQKSPNNVALQKNINAVFKVNLTTKDVAQLGNNYDALRAKIVAAYQRVDHTR